MEPCYFPVLSREVQCQGVVIKGYHTDIGIFVASDFMEKLLKNHQKIRFSWSGASHQNGAEEHAIKTLVTMSSTMLVHLALICPQYIFSTGICPMAMYYSLLVYNWIPGILSGLCAIEIWLRSRFEPVSKNLANFMFGFVQYMF